MKKERMFNLVNELKNYKSFDKDEESDRLKTLEFLSQQTNCFSRSNLLGHVNAGGLVVDGYGNILLNHHKILDMWFQFGGHSDGNENSLEVAKREIEEESGIKDIDLLTNGIFDVCVNLIDSNEKKHEPEHYHYDINFLFKTSSKNFVVSSESKELKWVSIDEALKLINSEDKSMRRMIEKYKNMLNL